MEMIITLYKSGADGSLSYYTMHDRQPLLTSRYALTLAWRNGQGREREKVIGFDSMDDMDAAIRATFRRKVRSGYGLLYSFMRERTKASLLGDSTAVGSAS